jgi:hypothetical protein
MNVLIGRERKASNHIRDTRGNSDVEPRQSE